MINYEYKKDAGGDKIQLKFTDIYELNYEVNKDIQVSYTIDKFKNINMYGDDICHLYLNKDFSLYSSSPNSVECIAKRDTTLPSNISESLNIRIDFVKLEELIKVRDETLEKKQTELEKQYYPELSIKKEAIKGFKVLEKTLDNELPSKVKDFVIYEGERELYYSKVTELVSDTTEIDIIKIELRTSHDNKEIVSFIQEYVLMPRFGIINSLCGLIPEISPFVSATSQDNTSWNKNSTWNGCYIAKHSKEGLDPNTFFKNLDMKSLPVSLNLNALREAVHVYDEKLSKYKNEHKIDDHRSMEIEMQIYEMSMDERVRIPLNEEREILNQELFEEYKDYIDSTLITVEEQTFTVHINI